MGRCCFVPGCKTGYRSSKPVSPIALFQAPSDEDLLSKWRLSIPRRDKQIKAKDLVCDLHFAEHLVVKEWTAMSGNQVIMKMSTRAKLAKGAVPTIFPNCPSYLSKKLPKERNPRKRKADVLKDRPLSSKRRINQVCDNVSCNPETDIGLFTNEIGNTIEYELHGCDLPANPEIEDIHVQSFDEFCKLASGIRLPKTWSIKQTCTEYSKFICFYECGVTRDRHVIAIKQVTVLENLNVEVCILQKNVTDKFIVRGCSLEGISQLVSRVNCVSVCTGGPTPNPFKGVQPETASVDALGLWRHKKCDIFSENNQSFQCSRCSSLQDPFRIHLKRKQSKTQKKFQCRFRTPKSPSKQPQIAILRRAIKLQRRSFKLVEKKKKALQKELNDVKAKLKTVSEETLSASLQELNIPPAMETVIKECINTAKHEKPSSRRYSGDWLLMCLLIHIKGPKLYKLIRDQEILPFPCISTIRKYLSMMDKKCGFDVDFFELLKKKLEKKAERERHGIIIFDKIQVRKSLEINTKSMNFVGLADYGEEHKITNNDLSNMADHGLVFMFQAFADNHAQPVGVFASSGPTKSIILTQLLLKCISLLEYSGAYIDGFVADGASTNRGIWRELGISGSLTEMKNWFQHPLDDNRKIYAFSDAPHVFKCVRNRLFKKKVLKYENNIVRWSHYDTLFLTDSKLEGCLRVCPKLTLSHVSPLSSGEKMRVKFMSQVFSNSVAQGLEFYSKRGIDGLINVEGSVDFTLKLNNLFDALNRRYPLEGVRKGGKDFQVMKDSCTWLDTWEKSLMERKIIED